MCAKLHENCVVHNKTIKKHPYIYDGGIEWVGIYLYLSLLFIYHEFLRVFLLFNASFSQSFFCKTEIKLVCWCHVIQFNQIIFIAMSYVYTWAITRHFIFLLFCTSSYTTKLHKKKLNWIRSNIDRIFAKNF